MKKYKELYYRLFILFKSYPERFPHPHFYAVLALTFSIYFFVVGLYVLVLILLQNVHLEISFINAKTKLIVISIVILFGFLNYSLLATPSKQKKICERQKKDKELMRSTNNFTAILYLIITILLPLLFFIILAF